MIQMPTLLLKYFSYVCHTNRAANMTLTSLMLFRTTKKTTFKYCLKRFHKKLSVFTEISSKKWIRSVPRLTRCEKPKWAQI